MRMPRKLLVAGLLVLPSPILAQADAWALHGHDLGGQRYSPLTDINTTTVSRLVPRWTWHSGVTATFQATPIEVDGVLYVSLPFSGVAALDAASGREIWRYKHESRSTKLCCGPANRGVAVSGGKVYVGTVDGRLVALDARTGARVWDILVAEYEGSTEATNQLRSDDSLSQVGKTGSTGVGISAAPIVHDGKVFVGIAGVGYGLHPDKGLAVVGLSGQYGRPGLMAAFDAKTGKALWKFNVTGPGWEGTFRTGTPDGVPMQRDIARERADSAADADAWKYGGGSIYASPVIDAAASPAHLRHRQSVAADGRCFPSRRQPLHLLAGRARPSHRPDGMALPAGTARPLGLRRRELAGTAGRGPGRQADPGRGAGEQDRLGIRARPARRDAALQVGRLRTAAKPLHPATAG